MARIENPPAYLALQILYQARLDASGCVVGGRRKNRLQIIQSAREYLTTDSADLRLLIEWINGVRLADGTVLRFDYAEFLRTNRRDFSEEYKGRLKVKRPRLGRYLTRTEPEED